MDKKAKELIEHWRNRACLAETELRTANYLIAKLTDEKTDMRIRMEKTENQVRALKSKAGAEREK